MLKRACIGGTLLLFILAAACKKNKASDLTEELTEDERGDGMRLALLQLREGLTEMPMEQLLNSGALKPSDPVIDQTLTRNLREGLVGSARYLQSIREGEARVMRTDRYAVELSQGPFKIKGWSGEFPFDLKAGGHIEISRPFPSREAAGSAARPSLDELPYSVENVLRLDPGTYVSIPVTGRLALEANGRTLSQAFQHADELAKFITTSATGTLSGAAQGTMVGSGFFQLQLVRLDENKVRVRVTSGSDWNGAASGKLDLAGGFRYVFLPSAPLQKIRDFKEKIEQGIKHNPARDSLTNVRQRIEAFKKEASNEVRAVIDSVPGEVKVPALEQLLNQANQAVDTAVAHAEQTEASLAKLDQTIFGRADAAVEQVNSAYQSKLAPTVDALKSHSNRVLDMKAALELRADFKDKVRNIADYVFDLSSPEGRQAFERAFFGRTVWMSAAAEPTSQKLSGQLFYDLTAAESIAAEDEGKASRRVERLATVMGELREDHIGLGFQSVYFKAGTDRYLKENRVALRDSKGRHEDWLSRVWEFNHDVKIGNLGAKETYASGFLTPVQDDKLASGAYWFTWKGAFGTREKAPVKRSLETAHMLLGPLAVRHGVPALYAGEHPGQVDARFSVVFHGEALSAIFDANRATDALLWKAMAHLAQTVNAEEIGLPFADTAMQPQGLATIPGAVEACEVVALYWGRLYCSIFQEDFLKKLHQVRRSTDPVARLAFFEQYYRTGFLFNRLGAKLLVRFMAELMERLELSDRVELDVSIVNNDNPSMAASPSLKSGKSREIQMLDSLDLLEVGPVR